MNSTNIKDPVNLSLGDKISSYAGTLTRQTHQNSPWVSVEPPDEHFRAEIPFTINTHLLPGVRQIIAPDGIGTKVLLIDAASGWRNASRDLIAMTAGDITRSGGCPIIFSNVLDVSSLGEDENSETFSGVRQLFDGLVDVANTLKFACIKGETAELSVCVSSPNPDAVVKFNWAGFMIGLTHPDKRITGHTLAPGQVVVALKEDGFRSNGISAVRATMQKRFGDDWWSQRELVEQISTPSTLYDHFFTWLNGWNNTDGQFEPYLKPHLICHLSGGSFKSKFFEDILKRKGLSAYLDDLWTPPGIVQQCAKMSGMSGEQLYEKWSCGQGALVVLDDVDVSAFINHAKKFGISAKTAGIITKEAAPQLVILSKFFHDQFVVYR